MKKLSRCLAVAVLLTVGAFSAPANAAPANPIAPAAASDLMQVQHRHHSHHRHWYHPRKVCKLRTVVKRGYHGRRVVTRVRVCR
jgi:hypothetical protein